MKFVNKNKVAASPGQAKTASSKAGGASKTNFKTSGRKSFTLLIGDEGAILVFMSGSTVLRRLFAASSQIEHTAAFVALMKANPNVPVSLLIDVIDQQYVRHTFPPVSPMSIAGLVSRRIERDFQPEDMKNALKLGREQSGRREWQYLIIALTNTPHMQHWLDFILELPNRCLGVYLLPVEMQQIIPALRPKNERSPALPWQFLISHNKVSGFRQTVLHNGNLVFTRVSQAIEDATPAVIAGSIEQEIVSTLEYLRRMSLTDNQSLSLMIICAREYIEAIDLNRFGAGSTLMMTPVDVANVLGLQQAALSADRFGDVVIAGAFARMRKRVLTFSNPYARKLQKLYYALLAMRVVTALCVLGFMLAAGARMLNMFEVRETTYDAEQKKRTLQPQLMLAKQADSDIGKDISYKSLVVSTNDYYVKDMPLPQDFIAQLAPVLPHDVRVNSFQWGVPHAANVPSAAANAPKAASASGQLKIRVGMELTGSYASLDDATRFANKLIADIKAAMPSYEIAADPFSWASADQRSQEIILDQPTAKTNAIASGENKIYLTFSPKASLTSAGAK